MFEKVRFDLKVILIKNPKMQKKVFHFQLSTKINLTNKRSKMTTKPRKHHHSVKIIAFKKI